MAVESMLKPSRVCCDPESILPTIINADDLLSLLHVLCAEAGSRSGDVCNEAGWLRVRHPYHSLSRTITISLSLHLHPCIPGRLRKVLNWILPVEARALR